jgi:hypothetical protein
MDNTLLRFTCTEQDDADLAGLPASVYAYDRDDASFLLHFDNGSALRVPYLTCMKE